MTSSPKVIIEKLVHGGMGLARLEGKACFVEGGLPGEQVSIQIVSQKQKHLSAVVTEIHEASPDRVTPPCPYFSRCGGCQWQHFNYAAQLQWKQFILEETLEKIGGVASPTVLPTIPAPKTENWRSRVIIHSDGHGKVGFYEPNSRKVVDIDQCLIATDRVNAQLQVAREKMRDTKGDLELRDDGNAGFSQANQLQNENLRKLVLEWAQSIPHDFIFELFCGSGNFTRDLILIAKKVVAVDCVEEAIADARRSINPEVGRGQVEFLCGDAAQVFRRYVIDQPLDLLVLDPPRDGCGRMVEGVLKHRPKNILYVSCNPATLARDVKFLQKFACYRLVQTQPVDMFPHSYHIESLTWLCEHPLP